MKTHKWLLGLLGLLMLLRGGTSATADVCNVDAPEASVSGFSPVVILSGVSDMVSHLPDRLVVLDGGGVYSRQMDTLADAGKDPVLLGASASSASPPRRLNDGEAAIVAATSSGTVTRVDIGSSFVVDTWTRNLSRSGCSGDTIAAAPVIHLRSQGSPAFQAAYPTDLTYIATKYGCGTRTANRVYALRSDTGAIEWIFNDTATVDLDFVSSAPALGAATDTLYVTSERTSSSTQNSVWAIDVLTGTQRWAVSEGRIWASPVLAGDRIYIANLEGELKALSTTDGSEIWSLSSGGIPFPTNLVVSGNLIAATDFYGRIAVAQDDGVTAAWVYNTTLPDGDPPPSLPMVPSVLPASSLTVDPLGNLFVGADDGKIYQLDLATGAVTGHRTLETDGTDVDEVLLDDAGISLFAASLSGQIARFCAPFALPCEQDFESDGDVDGNDLVQEINAGGAHIDQIAGEFGRTDCPL